MALSGLIAAIYARRRTDLMPRFLLALVLVLGGCAASHATAGLDEPVHGIKCSGADHTWDLCAERAAAIRGARGYDVLAAGGGTAGMTRP